MRTRRSLLGSCSDYGSGPVDYRGRLDHVAVQAKLLRIEAESQPNQLGKVQDRHVELAADNAFCDRLLEVEVQVAERARGHEAVGVRIDGVAQVAPGLLERGLLVHRDDREAA